MRANGFSAAARPLLTCLLVLAAPAALADVAGRVA